MEDARFTIKLMKFLFFRVEMTLCWPISGALFPQSAFSAPGIGDESYYVSLIIEADGNVTPGGISGSENKQVKEQLMSAVKDMPDWKSGKKAGKAVPVKEMLFLKKN